MRLATSWKRNGRPRWPRRAAAVPERRAGERAAAAGALAQSRAEAAGGATGLGPSGAPSEALSSAAAGLNGEAPLAIAPRRRARGAPRQRVTVLHWFPGRLRLRVPPLHRAVHL